MAAFALQPRASMAARKKSPSKKKALKGKKAGPRKPRLAKRPTPRPGRAAKVRRHPPKENPEALALALHIVGLAQGKKAEDLTVIDARRRGAAVGYDYIVIGSGGTDRQLGAIVDAVYDAVRAQGRRPSSVETSPDWVLVNYDDVIAHFFTPEKRQLYDLEGLWTDAPRVPLAR